MSKKKILFADDKIDFLNVRKEFLENAGYSVIPVNNPEQAEERLVQGGIDLAILDIRLVDDSDDKDTSGLDLAKRVARSVPKIILTQYPSWEAVREALGPDLNGLPPAVDFVAKQEGPEAMLRAVDWNLRHPYLKRNILINFDVPNMMGLPERMVILGPEEATRRLNKSFENTLKDLSHIQRQEFKRASQYHYWALVSAILGILIVLIGAVFSYLGLVPSSMLLPIAGVISESVGVLFFTREDAAHKRISAYYARLEEVNKFGNILTVCDTIPSSKKREEYRLKIIDKIINKWSGQI